jgi:hypothetical protein
MKLLFRVMLFKHHLISEIIFLKWIKTYGFFYDPRCYVLWHRLLRRTLQRSVIRSTNRKECTKIYITNILLSDL